MASKRNGTIYVGVTSDPIKRVWQHKNSIIDGFTKEYNVHMLVWYEIHSTMEAAINREKRLKTWSRKWKLNLIEKMNPEWKDLYESIIS